MNTATTAATATELPDDAGRGKQWVQLVPSGTFYGEDGRGPYKVDPAAVVAGSHANRKGKMHLVVDFVHQTQLGATSGTPAPAAGWIVTLQAREDGVWGEIEWTPAGRKALAGREYRHLSPVFAHDRVTGIVSRLLGAGLTNIPNIAELPALHSRQEPVAPATLAELLRQVREQETDQAAVFAACGVQPPTKQTGT